MPNATSDTERVQKLEEKIRQLTNQKNAIASRAKEKERKYRTRRLIQNGALAEQYFNCTGIEPADFELLLKKLIEIEAVKDYTQKKEA